MKTLAIAIIASFSIGSAFAQAAKQPEGIVKTAPAVTAPAAPAKAEAPSGEMKLAKKKADKEAEAKAKKDATKSSAKDAPKADKPATK